MAINPNTNFTAGAILTADQQNRFPRGVIGAQSLTSNFTTSATHTTYQDSGLTLTVAVSTTRLYKMCFTGNPYASGGLQGMTYRILEGATSRNEFSFGAGCLDAATSLFISPNMYFTPLSSGTLTFKIQLKATSNNTAVSDFGSANQIRMFWIEDIGPA
jgi:hypothetical protein